MAPEKDDKKVEPPKDILRRVPGADSGRKDLGVGETRRKSDQGGTFQKEPPKSDPRPPKK